MNNILDILGVKPMLDDNSVFVKYREESLAKLGELPTLKSEQYSKIDIGRMITDALAKSSVSLDNSFSYDSVTDDYIVKDIEKFACENSDIFNVFFSTVFEKGAIEEPSGTQFKNRSLNRSSLVDLNSSFLNCGTVTYIPKNKSISTPIEIDITHENIVLGRRDIIIVDKFSKVTIIVNNLSNHVLLNRVCEIYLQENSSLDIIEINLLNKSDNTINHIAIKQDVGSNLRHYNIAATDKKVRYNIKAMLNGSGADAKLFGANLVYNGGVVSTNTVMEHNTPNCTSDEHYKNVSTNIAISDFAGIIFVNDDAQNTDANQRNDNILLSDSARCYAKPQLEIYADDVKCTHGATVGQLSDEALFYMMQRGISEHDAKKLLLTGFLNDILMKIENDKIRENLIDKVSSVILSVQ